MIRKLIESIRYKLFTPPYIKHLNKGLYFPKSYIEYTEHHTEAFSLKWDWVYTPSNELYKLSNIRKICLCGFEYIQENPDICPTCKMSALTKDDEIDLLMMIDKSIYLNFTPKPYMVNVPNG